MHGDQITIDNAGINHRQTTHFQQVIRLGAEQMRIQGVTPLHILDRQNRRTGGHTTNQRQAQLLNQANATCRTRLEHNRPFLGQRPQMLFRCIGGSKAEGRRNFHASRRCAEHFQRIFDEIENFLLAWRQFHDRCLSNRITVILYSPV